MAMISKQLEVVNNHESEVGTSSFVENNASKEAEIKPLMIRLYKEIMQPMIIPAYVGNDKYHGSREIASSVDEIARVNASKDYCYHRPEMELMIRIYNETICPMMCADIEAMQQKFLSAIEKKFGVDLSTTGMKWQETIKNFGNTGSTSGPQALQLQFINGISTPVSTRKDLKGKDETPFALALVDGVSGEPVKTGAAAEMEVEIVVLEGDSANDEAENWTSDELSCKIISEWNGRKVLQGKTFVKMKEGFVFLDKISFTHNSDWKKERNCRLSARPANAALYGNVKAAVTESFPVKDKRKLMYTKKPNPLLSDYVYRLNMISNRGKCFKHLCKANIKTVMDLLTVHAINPKRLKEVLGVHNNTWKVIMDHAQKCKDRSGVYLYHDSSDDHGVVFNVSGQLVGLTADSQFVPCDKLPREEKADAQKLIVASSEHWEKLISFNNLPSLISHLQSHTTINTLRNNLNLVIPQTDTHDHTSHISPHVVTPNFPKEYCTNNKNNWRYDSAGAAGQSQSTKRPASEHIFSNPPKKPRNDHFSIGPTTPSVGTFLNDVERLNLATPEEVEDDDCMQYLNDFVLDKWKMVVYAVGWISKVRKRRMTLCHDDMLIVIAATMNQDVQM